MYDNSDVLQAVQDVRSAAQELREAADAIRSATRQLAGVVDDLRVVVINISDAGQFNQSIFGGAINHLEAIVSRLENQPGRLDSE